MEFVLDNGSVRVALSTAGGSFTSIKANGREYLWQGDPSVWSGQAPICFPICGGLRNGRAMTMGGREVKLARHGFARKQEWKLEEQGDNMVALSLSSATMPNCSSSIRIRLRSSRATRSMRLRWPCRTR